MRNNNIASPLDPGLRTVDRALTLLSHLSDRPGGHALRDLSHDLRLNKTVLFRLMRTMLAHGYVVQDADTHAYRLGPRAHGCGHNSDASNVFALARGPMQQLASQTGFSCFLTLPLAFDTVCVDRAEAPTLIRVSYEIGRRLPYHAGAPGKVLLAFFDAERRAEVLNAGRLARYTKTTTASKAVLRTELDAIRERGYATSVGEIDEGISGVATVLLDSASRPLAALSLSAPQAALEKRLFEQLGHHLVATSASISNLRANQSAQIPRRREA